MKHRLVVLYALGIVGLFSFLGAAAVRAQSTSDEAAVRAQIQRLVDYFNAKNAAGIAQLYAPDADRRDGAGVWARGRTEIAAMYERTVRAIPDGVIVRFEFSVRFVNPGVALADGEWKASDGRRGPFTIVAIKNATQWSVAAGRQGPAFP